MRLLPSALGQFGSDTVIFDQTGRLFCDGDQRSFNERREGAELRCTFSLESKLLIIQLSESGLRQCCKQVSGS